MKSVAGSKRGIAGFCLLVIALAGLGCSQSAQDHLADARRGLSDALYDDALAAADAGLAASPDPKTEWGLEMVKLEALARGGYGEEAGGQLSTLENTYPERVPVTQYAATAGQLRAAGRGPEAIQVIDYGLQRFPDDEMLTRLLGAGDSDGVGSAELDMLRSLGYVE
jgi:hypothetical protein